MIGIDRQSVGAMQTTAKRLYGLEDGVMLIEIAPGSPAASVGLRSRDVITGAAKGANVMPSGWDRSTLTIQYLAKVILSSAGGPITLLVRRDGNVSPVVLTPALGCKYPIEAIYDDRFNAFADGSRIVVFTGVFNHVPDDREVAVIVGHELAHNILRHVDKTKGNIAIGGSAGLLVDIGLLALGVNTQGAVARAGM
jgi:Zn-dependent protease with chaperone function